MGKGATGKQSQGAVLAGITSYFLLNLSLILAQVDVVPPASA